MFNYIRNGERLYQDRHVFNIPGATKALQGTARGRRRVPPGVGMTLMFRFFLTPPE